MAAAAILKNPKTPYLGQGSSDFDEIWHGYAPVHLLESVLSSVT